MDPFVPELIASLTTVGFLVVFTAISLVGGLGLAAAALPRRDDDDHGQGGSVRSFASIGLRPTVDEGWVGALNGRAVRARRISPSEPHGQPKWSLELDLHDAELEVVNSLIDRAWHTGDVAFDDIFRARSSPETVGLLSSDVRRALLALTPGVRVHVIAGQLELVGDSRYALVGRAEQAAAAADLLDAAAGGTVADRLVRRVHGDPVDGVRAQALGVLRQLDIERAVEVAESVELDGHPLLCIEQALVLQRIDPLAAMVRDPSLPEVARARAGRAAARVGTPEECAPLAMALAIEEASVVDQAALELALRAEGRGVDALMVLVRGYDAEVASEAAEALGALADVSVVEELRRLAERSSTRHARALRDTIRRIQERATTGRGEVSLARDDVRDGAVSVARRARKGALSST